MTIDPTAFRSNPFFAGLSREDVDAILQCGVVNRYTSGNAVFLEGDEGEAMYIVLSGEVEIEVRNKEGMGEIVALFRAGEFFGEGSLVTKGARSATAVVTKDAYLLAFSRLSVDKLLDSRPKAAARVLWKLLGVVLHRLRVTTHRLAQQ